MLGTYSIDANGDTSLTDYGLYVIKDGMPDVLQEDRGGRRVVRPRTRLKAGTGGLRPARPAAFGPH